MIWAAGVGVKRAGMGLTSQAGDGRPQGIASYEPCATTWPLESKITMV